MGVNDFSIFDYTLDGGAVVCAPAFLPEPSRFESSLGNNLYDSFDGKIGADMLGIQVLADELVFIQFLTISLQKLS